MSNQEKTKKIIAFDFDGTIANTKPLFLDLLIDLQEKYSSIKNHKTKEHYDRLLKEGNLKCIERELQIPFYRIIPFIKEFRNEFKKNVAECGLFEGIEELLSTLYNNKFSSLGIVSSNSHDSIENFLERKGIKNYFDFIYSDNLKFEKCNLLKKLINDNKIESNNLFPSEGYTKIIYIGDESRDISACKKVGIPIISALWGYEDKNYIIKNDYDYLAETPKDVKKVLETIDF